PPGGGVVRNENAEGLDLVDLAARDFENVRGRQIVRIAFFGPHHLRAVGGGQELRSESHRLAEMREPHREALNRVDREDAAVVDRVDVGEPTRAHLADAIARYRWRR